MTEPVRDPVLPHVGANIRRCRTAAGLSQNQLAAAAGVSRRTIINLEAGQANIGLSTLDTVATVLGVTFVDLVIAPTAVRGRIDELAWTGVAPESAAILLGSAPATRECQLWTWTLGSGDRYDAQPDPTGWHEMVVVTAGRLLLERDDGRETVDVGDHAIYSSAQRYSYINLADGTTTFLRVVTA